MPQSLKNLLSNAFKFTHHGHVAFTITAANGGWSPENEELSRAHQVIAFSVSDTGIGISPDKQQIIFEAFQQADGSTSRKYGGTGLGLAISRELSRLLGGEIRLVSAPGKGSTFTLYLPQSYNPSRSARHLRVIPGPVERDDKKFPVVQEPARDASSSPPGMEEATRSDDDNRDSVVFANIANDDRDDIATGDRVLLIVENDLAFAKMLLESARQSGFKGLVSTTGAGALAMTREFHPSAITLDIFLPDMQGWRILDRLKADLETRHIPVCVLSTDDARERALQAGVLAFIGKPLQSKDVIDRALAELYGVVNLASKTLLIAMPASSLRQDFLASLEQDIECIVADDAEAARKALPSVDAAVIDVAFPDLNPEDVLDAIERRSGVCRLPVVLYDAGTVADSPWRRPRGGYAQREARSLEMLLAHTALFLHRSPAVMSNAERQAVETLHGLRTLAGKKALIVDDDMRNIFALATLLDDQGMVIVSADNGREAIRMIARDPTIDIVLMDIMMPEMDGMATMQEIRKLPGGRELPMVAVTAKAMKGDRQKCIEAGAWDYLSKPVDPAHLLAVLRGWLCR